MSHQPSERDQRAAINETAQRVVDTVRRTGGRITHDQARREVAESIRREERIRRDTP